MQTEKYSLDNGLNVLLAEQHTAPVVSMAVWVGVGSADETMQELGLAHVHEHMLFKGTTLRGVGEIAQEVEASGGSINAFTTFDHTVYYVTISSRYFERGLDILCDAICNSCFDPEELSRELEVILEEIKRGEDNPSRQTMEAVFETAFETHPYKRPVIGSAESVSAFSREDVLSFYRKWYVAKNMTLVVVGDVEADKAKLAIEQKMADLSTSEPPARRRTSEASQEQTRVALVNGQTPEVHMAMAFHTPPFGHEDMAALDVLRLLLGYGDSSRLSEKLERELQWVNDARAGAYTPRDPGLFMVTTDHIDAPDHPGVCKVAAAAMEVVSDMGRNPISRQELLRAKTLLKSSQLYQRQTMEDQAMVLGSYESVAGNHGYEEVYNQNLSQVGIEDLMRVTQTYFTPENLSIVVYAAKETVSKIDAEALKEAATRGLSGEAAIFEQAKPLLGDEDGIVRVALDEGPTVLVQEDNSVELVSIRVAFMGGQRNEPAHLAGVSHLLSSLWTRGTETKSLTDMAREVELMGSGISAYSGRNSMGIQMEMLSAHFNTGMAMIADCLSNPTFDADLLEIERRLVLEAIKARSENLNVVAGGLARGALFGDHPYARDPLGNAETIAAITREDILTFYHQCVRSDEMVISVVGDVSAGEVVASVKERFGQDKGLMARALKREKSPVPSAGSIAGPSFVHTALDKKQALVVLSHQSVDIYSEHRFKLDLISSILSGQGGRLFLELRDRRSLAYSVFSSNLIGVDPGAFSLNIATSPEKIDESVRGLVKELEKLKTEEVSQAELDRAKLFIVGNHDIQLQSFGSRSIQLTLDELYGLGYRNHRDFPKEILALSAADLMKTARALFTPGSCVLTIVCPPETQLPDLQDLGFVRDDQRQLH